MIRVTQDAAAGLRQIVSGSRTPSDFGVKLVPLEHQDLIGMAIGRPGDGDILLGREHDPLLIVDSSLVDHLDGAVIDTEEDEQGRTKLVIHRRGAAEADTPHQRGRGG